MNEKIVNQPATEETLLKAKNGMPMLLLNLALIVVSIVIFIWGIIHIDQQQTLAGVLMGVAIFYWCLPVWLLFAGCEWCILMKH